MGTEFQDGLGPFRITQFHRQGHIPLKSVLIKTHPPGSQSLPFPFFHGKSQSVEFSPCWIVCRGKHSKGMGSGKWSWISSGFALLTPQCYTTKIPLFSIALIPRLPAVYIPQDPFQEWRWWCREMELLCFSGAEFSVGHFTAVQFSSKFWGCF